MRTSDALWELFKVTGRIGAYLLYRQCSAEDREIEDVFEAGQGKA
ncbi:MAG: hypothetical protein RO469_07125 [Thermincola sp.]|nr:hypothetical protein [Thermincola sp.]MDT3704292.1 hypothetical protein [Thermincola sp.]